jgi:hypothetical protein
MADEDLLDAFAVGGFLDHFHGVFYRVVSSKAGSLPGMISTVVSTSPTSAPASSFTSVNPTSTPHDHATEIPEEPLEEDPHGSEKVRFAQPGPGGRFGHPSKVPADNFEIILIHRARDQRRQCLRDNGAGFAGIGGLAQGTQGGNAARPLRETGHEEDDGIDQTPRDVASDSTKQHRPHILPAGLSRTDGAGEGKRHDQSEQHFGSALDWIQQAFGGFISKLMVHDFQGDFSS